MKVKIIAEKRTSTPKPSPIGFGWICSTYHAIKECTINGKKVTVDRADIETSGGVEFCYGQKKPISNKKTQLILGFLDKTTLTYNVQSISGKDDGNIRKLEIEVDDEKLDWKYFKGSIEITVEVKTKKEAQDFFSELSYQIINSTQNVYKTRYTIPKEC